MLNAYMTDKVVILRVVRDEFGSPTEKKMAMMARMEEKTRLVRNRAGEMVASSAQVLLPIMRLTHEDRIQYDGKDYAILGIEKVKDFSSKFLRVNLA